jgi:hypothetical protein
MIEHNNQVKSIDESFEPSLEEMVNASKTVNELITLWKKVEPTTDNIALFNRRKSEIEKEGRVSNGLR